VISRRKIDERIRKKEQEIQELELKLREAKAYIQALNDVVKLMPRGDYESTEVADLRAGSLMAKARDAILKAGQPLHISDLLKATGKEPTRKNRASLGGSISAYVRRGEVFTRPRPNTFGLAEMEPSSAAIPTPAPPGDFGIDDDPF
jgi:hypothetical protein